MQMTTGLSTAGGVAKMQALEGLELCIVVYDSGKASPGSPA
jgi:hypothetical protein